MDTLLQIIDDAEVNEKPNSCNHFLIESELEKGKHCAFSFATSSYSNSVLNQIMDQVFSQLKCAAKVNLVSDFVLKNIADGTCRYIYAHKNKTVMDKSKLLCTEDDLANLKDKL